MDAKQIVDEAAVRLQTSVDRFGEELKKIHTGRANASMLDGVVVDAYGSQMPLIQVATVSTPEPQLLQISPFDPSNLQTISSAIRDNQSLGLNPMDDGRVIRIPIPPLTTERRQQIVKQVKEKQEEFHILQRNIRHETIKKLKSMEQAKDISKDDEARGEKGLDEAMEKAKNQLEAMSKAKEQELLTV